MRSNFVRITAALSLTLCAGAFLWVGLSQFLYAGFAESPEGDVLAHIERVVSGLDPYPWPGSDFVAITFMPLYYYISSPFYMLFGDSLSGPRLVSLICATLSGISIGWIAWRESKSRAVALVASAFYFAGYRIMDAMLFCAMPDALMLFFVMAGFCFLAYGTRWEHDLLWLFCFSLAFWTKQQGAFYFGFAVMYSIIFRKNYLPRWGIILGLIIGGPISYVLIGSLLGDAFFFHTFIVPGRWDHRLWLGIRRTAFVLTCYVPFASFLTLVYLREEIRARKARVSALAWFSVTSLLAATFTMAAAGSSNNHYIPFIALLSVSSALGLQRIVERGASGIFGGLLIGATVLSFLGTLLGLRVPGIHDVRLYVPFAMLGCLVLYAMANLIRFINVNKEVVIGVALLVGQIIASGYYPPNYAPERGYQEGIARLRSEVEKLDGELIWVNYGNTPAELTGVKLARAPSWVVLHDVERQRGVEKEARNLMEPFRERIVRGKKLHLLLSRPLQELDVYPWTTLEGCFELEKDYGDYFSLVTQVGYHWFGGGGYPRYLYQKKENEGQQCG